MKRIHLIEFEDMPWFPAWLRGYMTNLLVVFMRAIKMDLMVAHEVSKALEAASTDHIVDLGSGSGGVMPGVLEHVRAAGREATLVMTDLYPNKEVIARYNADVSDHITYHEDPVDATKLAEAPEGLKTMVNIFHHMTPQQAKTILTSAHSARQPLLIVEAADGKIPTLAWWLFLPLGLFLVGLSSLFFTPLVRPLSAGQLVFTYVIPLVPLFYAWDGQVSAARIYGEGDLEELLEGLRTDDYHWEIRPGEDRSGKKSGLCLIGRPV